uniref:Lipoprotein n=1 Tax=Melittangium lichenicola TaxID=45 RepID=A0A3Q8I339_9BACT|nr:lipoprotein [Melittangium lichenicola]
MMPAMTSRLGLVVGLMACLGMGCREQAAVRITLSFPNFKPGCVRMSVQDAGGMGEPITEELVEKPNGKPWAGEVKVAAFPGEGWGKRVTVTATAFEQACGQGPEFSTSGTVDLGSSITPVDLKLEAMDGDGDGYVSRESGGSDCADGEPTVNPGRTELCNNRDDNCNSRADEGFEAAGQSCGSAGACQTLACNAEGALSCQTGSLRWYRDQDGDGEGTAQDSKDSCTQPAGYVLNSRDCDDTKRTRYSTATELCNGENDNCDDTVDEGFNVGASCMDGICASQRACVSTTQAACKSVQKTWFRDQDGDQHGATGAGTPSCQGTPPAGYVASSDDCDDTKTTVYKDAPELCDSFDNDCDSQKDEGFDVGVTCSAANDCSGTKACTASGTTTECKATTPPTQYYVDNDSDGYGQNGTGPLTCNTPSGYVTRGGDCRDGNPYIHPGAPELCDREDNDCNTATSEASVCPASGESWASYASDTADIWRSVALYDNGGVWIAGGDKLSLRKAGQFTFDDLSCASGEDVYGIATNPTTGEALLGGSAGFLARSLPAVNSCTNKGRQGINADVKGVHLVPLQDKLENILVGVNTQAGTNKGRAIRVLDSMGTGYDNREIRYGLKDVNGPSRDLLFAVGSPLDDPPGSHIYRFDPATGNWLEETVPPGGGLSGVWVVNSKLAYAVGDNGTLLTWNGTTWSKVTGGPGQNLSAVVAFGTQSLYVTTLNGKLYYYNGTTWTELLSTSGVQFLDIAANNPGDIWVVGSRGVRYHWPQ